MTQLTRSQPLARVLLRLGIAHLWIVIVLAGIGSWIALAPTPPNDFWWHLKAGQLVAMRGIPQTNLFAWTLPPDHPYVYATWLGEWLFFQLYQLAGLQLVTFARNVLGLMAFALVAVDARRRSHSWRLAAIATALAGAMTINNLIIRTQNWSWVPFGVYVLILGAYAEGQLRPRRLVVLPLIMVFWVNAHGAFVLGLAILAIYALGETLRRLLKHPGALWWERIFPLYGALVGAVAATLINPLGFGIFGYVLKLLTDPSSQQLVVEWQPPTTHSIAGFIFYATLLVFLMALAWARRRPSITDMLLVCAFLWLAWSGQRYVVWFGMVAMPILAQCFAAPPGSSVRSSVRVGMTSVNFLIAGALVVMWLAVQPPFKASLALPRIYVDNFADLPGAPLTFDNANPVAATEYLRTHPQPGRLFNEMGYGSYLDWALYPQIQVFIDPRVELYPMELWQDYIAITNARDYNTLLIQKYNITRVMLDREFQPKLAEALRRDHEWMLEYQDHRTEIYRRPRRDT